MKNKIYILNTVLSGIMLLYASMGLAQNTGVFIQDPTNPLHVNAASNSLSTTDDVVISNSGNIGVGVVSPITKVDLRSSDQKGIIGIGTNASQTASDAKAGAIRYNISGYLEYSDGDNWIPLYSTAPTKALINVAKTSAQTVNSGADTYIVGWDTPTVDTTSGAFVPTSGTFTAPRDGFYLVAVTITLSSATIANNTYMQTSIVSNQVTDNIPVYKTVNAYPAFQAATRSNNISGSCNAIFNLKAGNTIRFQVFQNTTTNRTTTGATYNTASITEL